MHLFVRNISKNISKDTIQNVIGNLGFGTIKEIIYPLGKRNQPFQNAIVLYNSWDIENTQYTRSILESGRNLTIYAEDDEEYWKVFRYNSDKNVPMIAFPDILLPNVTDNRKHRRNQVRYNYTLTMPEASSEESLSENLLYAPKKQKTKESVSQELLSSIRMKLLFDE
jgi:hypothetical protein